jgi:choline dehydrogenase
MAEKMTMGFDYIIVGAGSAGCVLANRLSEDPACSVALIEAGGEPDPRLAPIPGAASWMQNTRSDWSYTTTPQRELFDRKIPYPRGRVIGGTSILNYMVYIRGNAGDFDQWAQMGNIGWSYRDVLPYFNKAETNARFDDEFHGQSGPLSVEHNAHTHPLGELFIEAATSLGIPFNPDFNGETQWGCGYYQATLKNGKRASTATAYLDPVRDRPNLTVLKDTHVLRVLIEKGRAVGIECVIDGREVRKIHADCEIVLSAGAIGSPHIMMLSGLGPADHLREHGIETILDNAEVGQNLEDHLGPGSVSANIRDPDAVYGNVAQSFEDGLQEFERTGGGVLATHYLDFGAFFSVDLGTEYPQCQTFMTPGVAEFYRKDGVPDRSRFCMGGYPCRAKSRGSVTLSSSNPLDPPVIDPNYLSEPDDLRMLVEHVKWNQMTLNAKPFEKVREGPAEPVFNSDSEVETFVRQTASTIWHPTSTCRMGQEGRSVVSPELAVHGVDGLSVCDASVMPTMASGNVNAPIIMVAEKGADLIKARS